MFAVSEADAEAVRHTLQESGELAAAVELRRRFPGLPSVAAARDCVRIIAGWKPLPASLGRASRQPRRPPA